MDKNGLIVASSNESVLNSSRSDRDYFQQAIKGKAAVSDALEEVTATVQEQSAMVQNLAEMVETIESLSNELAQAAGEFKVE